MDFVVSLSETGTGLLQKCLISASGCLGSTTPAHRITPFLNFWDLLSFLHKNSWLLPGYFNRWQKNSNGVLGDEDGGAGPASYTGSQSEHEGPEIFSLHLP